MVTPTHLWTFFQGDICLLVFIAVDWLLNFGCKIRHIPDWGQIHSAAGLTIFAIIHHLVDVNEVTPV